MTNALKCFIITLPRFTVQYFVLLGEFSILREIKSNLYIFSSFGANFGRIIESRVREGSPDGENVFAYLGISGKEQAFWREAQLNKPGRLIMLCGNRCGRCSAVLFSDFSGVNGSFCLAFEYFEAAQAVSTLSQAAYLGELPSDIAIVSDGAKALLSSEPLSGDSDVRFSISNEIRDVFMFSDSQGSRNNEPVVEMQNLAYAAASLVGLGMDFGIEYDFDDEVNTGTVFVRDFYAELITLLAAEARKLSRDRRMSVCIRVLSHGARICISYGSISDAVTESEKYLMQLALERDIPISFSHNNGECEVLVTPFVRDIALLGIKQTSWYFYDT